jgi:tungstate transport system substrate-binding protein
MVRTGMWQALSARFQESTGHRVEIVAAGPKEVIAPAMRNGRADVITMHASDTIINLVADGYALDPQPWAKNDLVIAGPPDDPAGIRGLTEAAEAMRRVVRAGCPFAAHQSLGALTVLRNVLRDANVSLDPEKTLMPPENPEREILAYAARHKAYTMVGRVPFLDGKMPRSGMDLMVQGDPLLRRPYVVAVADPKRWPDARYAAAKRLADFLREPDTQAWLAEFGRGKLDNHPIFFPVVIHEAD